MMSQALGGCVDSTYRVYGVNSLRVVDASILPIQVSSHLMTVLFGLVCNIKSNVVSTLALADPSLFVRLKEQLT